MCEAKLCLEVKKRLHCLQFVLVEFLTCLKCFLDLSRTSSCLIPSKKRLQVLQCSLGFLSLVFLNGASTDNDTVGKFDAWSGDGGVELSGVRSRTRRTGTTKTKKTIKKTTNRNKQGDQEEDKQGQPRRSRKRRTRIIKTKKKRSDGERLLRSGSGIWAHYLLRLEGCVDSWWELVCSTFWSLLLVL